MKYDFEAIKKHYQDRTPLILDTYSKRRDRWVSPYSKSIDWGKMFSPIEYDMWQVVRCYGHCPVYPQFPVGKYFLDFGHPGPRIGIECDGKQWHQDKGKDAARDEELRRLGWSIFRISGSDCVRIIDVFDLQLHGYDGEENLEILRNYYLRTAEGLVDALGIFYFDQPAYRHDNELHLAYECLMKRATTGEEFIENQFNNLQLREDDL